MLQEHSALFSDHHERGRRLLERLFISWIISNINGRYLVRIMSDVNHNHDQFEEPFNVETLAGILK